jgi:hypothetical protein
MDDLLLGVGTYQRLPAQPLRLQRLRRVEAGRRPVRTVRVRLSNSLPTEAVGLQALLRVAAHRLIPLRQPGQTEAVCFQPLLCGACRVRRAARQSGNEEDEADEPTGCGLGNHFALLVSRAAQRHPFAKKTPRRSSQEHFPPTIRPFDR